MHIITKIGSQTLTLFARDNTPLKEYRISTGANGIGQQKDSGQTPLGKHLIRAKIGAGAPVNTIFRGRRPCGLYHTGDMTKYPGRDWILTRILWLSGCEIGFNRLGNVDTMQRYIYIHGTPDEVTLGQPGSRGCIRMANDAIIELFDLVPVYTPIIIEE